MWKWRTSFRPMSYGLTKFSYRNLVASYKETVTNKSTQICMAKSQNKHNRIYVIAEPMDEKLVGEIDNKNTRASDDLKVISRLLIDKYELTQHDTKKIMGILS